MSAAYGDHVVPGWQAELRLRFPRVALHLIEPPHEPSPLVGPSMGFEASRAALRFGRTSVREWLATPAAAALRGDFSRG